MRALLFTLASLAAAGTAGAASIDNVTAGEAVNNSVSQVSCADCPPPLPKKKSSYIVPQIEPGTERVELKEINGEMKLVRTEAWLGGSPVVFIHKATDDDIREAQATMPGKQLATVTSAEAVPVEAQATAVVPLVDDTAKTSALSTIQAAKMASVTPQDSQSQEFDLKNFQLRLN